MCALCSVLVIDVNWNAARMLINAQTGKTLKRGKCLFFHGKSCLMLGSFSLGDGTGKVIPGNDYIFGSHHTAALAIKNGLDTGSEVSGRL